MIDSTSEKSMSAKGTCTARSKNGMSKNFLMKCVDYFINQLLNDWETKYYQFPLTDLGLAVTYNYGFCEDSQAQFGLIRVIEGQEECETIKRFYFSDYWKTPAAYVYSSKDTRTKLRKDILTAMINYLTANGVDVK